MNATRERVEAAVKDVAEGKLIVVVDDDDRENEGDLIMAASLATPEQVAFMIPSPSTIALASPPASRPRNAAIRYVRWPTPTPAPRTSCVPGISFR
jgi:3,4-dihydroxy 2-butanone 4-phosphate synthase/GTP cyclohydrolase II